MRDRQQDKEIGINTTGLINWPAGVNLDYFRTESTSYKDLDRFIAGYDFLEKPQMIDYGSGKGRVVFYLNYKKNIPTTGIEINQVAYSHLMQNYVDYQEKFPKRAEDILILETQAEKYRIKPEDNMFYFFNPFTVKIFEKVINNIEASLEQRPRMADVILYYPGFDYTYYLEKYSSFRHIQTIKTPMYYINNRECFKVFRYIPEL